MIFNNGSEAVRPYTTVVEFTPDMNADGSYNLGADGVYGPTELAWEYAPKEGEEFYSWFISGAQRQPNGNTLINHGAKARLREVTPEGDIVWELPMTTARTDHTGYFVLTATRKIIPLSSRLLQRVPNENGCFFCLIMHGK